MARSSIRRVSYYAASLVAAWPIIAAAILAPTSASAGTDVFGSGTGGIGSHSTSMYSSSYDTAGWGITGMKPLTPRAPDPALSVIPNRGNFGPVPGSDYLGANGYGGPLGAGVGSGNLGGTLQPLRGSAYSR
jgi:hypothetical protein